MVKKLYPFTGHYLDRNGLRYHYLDEGQGEAVVMLHGNPSWSFYYRRLVLALRGSYRIIVPDHIGCGLSDKPDDTGYDYTLEQRVHDLEVLLSHLNLQNNLTLVLHDWGGMIGMVYACRHPEQVRRLIIFNTAAFHLPRTKTLPWPLWLCRDTPVGPFLVRGLNAFSLAAAHVCSQRPLSRAVRQAYVAPYNSWQNRIAVLRFVQDIPLRSTDRSFALVTEVEKRLPLLSNVPMLICWGARDFVFDDLFLDQWRQHFPEAEVHRYAQAGHYVLEDAADQIIPLVQNFLKAHPLISCVP